MHSLSFTACSGENVYLYGSSRRCQLHFEVLCGLRKPELGTVNADGRDLYTMEHRSMFEFRSDNIGAIPRDGGLIPELQMIEQITLPMKLAGIGTETILSRLRGLTSEQMPLHSLYNLPSRCSARKQAYASILRAIIREPRIYIMNGFLDEFDDLDADALWAFFLSMRPKNSTLIYLSGSPAPDQVTWTRQLKL